MKTERAIELSAQENRIVTIAATDDEFDETDILAACEGYVETEARVGSGTVMTEYWGTTGSGHDWRVHVKRSSNA